MIEQEKQQLLEEALAWVNRVRDEHFLPPLDALRKGKRLCRDCPLANSIIDEGWAEIDPFAGRYSIGPTFQSCVMHDLPPLMKWFSHAFDDGELPELDEEITA